MSIEIEVLKPEIVANEIKAVVQKSGLAEDSALSLRGQFADFYNAIVEWREKAAMVTKPEDATHQKLAREIRLGLRRVRCDVENTRKTLKADSLARGKAIDGFANVLKYLCEPVEEKLAEVEQYAERQEAARIAALVAERTAQLVAVEADPTAYNLGAMDAETFTLVLHAAKKKQADRIEAERKAEAERVAREKAEAEERERIRAENERLKKEADEREAAMKAEREAAEARLKAEQTAAEAAAKAERARFETERVKERAEAVKKQAAAEAAAKAERDAREKAEREAADARKREADRIAAEKAAADAKTKSEHEAAEKAARAPDKAKVMAFAKSLLNVPKPSLTTEIGRELMLKICMNLDEFVSAIEIEAEAL